MSYKSKKIKSVTRYTLYHPGKRDESENKNTYTEFDPEGRILKEISFDRYGNPENQLLNIFTPEGDLLEERTLGEEGEVLETVTYIRDEKNKISRVNIEYADGSLTRKIYSRNPDENTTTITILGEDDVNEGKEYRKFNADGEILEEIIYNDEGEPVFHKTNRFDDEKRLFEFSIYDSEAGEKLTYRNKFNEEGRTVEVSVFDESGKMVKMVSQEFDEKGELVSQVQQNFRKGSDNYRVTFEKDEEKRIKTEEWYNTGRKTIEYKVLSHYDENWLLVGELDYMKDLASRFDYEFFD